MIEGTLKKKKKPTSCLNSTDSFPFPDVRTKDILTQVRKPPEKVHIE